MVFLEDSDFDLDFRGFIIEEFERILTISAEKYELEKEKLSKSGEYHILKTKYFGKDLPVFSEGDLEKIWVLISPSLEVIYHIFQVLEYFTVFRLGFSYQNFGSERYEEASSFLLGWLGAEEAHCQTQCDPYTGRKYSALDFWYSEINWVLASFFFRDSRFCDDHLYKRYKDELESFKEHLQSKEKLEVFLFTLRQSSDESRREIQALADLEFLERQAHIGDLSAINYVQQISNKVDKLPVEIPVYPDAVLSKFEDICEVCKRIFSNDWKSSRLIGKAENLSGFFKYCSQN